MHGPQYRVNHPPATPYRTHLSWILKWWMTLVDASSRRSLLPSDAKMSAITSTCNACPEDNGTDNITHLHMKGE